MAALAVPRESDDADRLRAQAYTLLAQFLARPPSRALLDAAARLGGDGSPLGRALGALAEAARNATPAGAEREYNALFIGVVRGELVPYASYYRTGFLNDRPLARVRQDLLTLGIERAPGVAEPEDHVATLCEVMAALIHERPGGTLGASDLDRQRRFFDRHLAPWAGHFFTDLEHAEAARLYRPVGAIGRLFMDIEAEAFGMVAREGQES